MELSATYVVVGGGISGVTCVETLSFLCPYDSIILISESTVIKTITNLKYLSKNLENFEVEEKNYEFLQTKHNNLKIIHDSLEEICNLNSFICTKNKTIIKYKFLCLCTGAIPNLIFPFQNIPQIIGIRDTDSIEKFIYLLKNSKKIAIVGNGGIASELVYKIENTEVHWIIKDNHISSTFIDPGAAEFLYSSVEKNIPCNKELVIKRIRFNEDNYDKKGAALGPDWLKNFNICGSGKKSLKIHYQTEIKNVNLDSENKNSLLINLNNGDTIIVDLIISATGVKPRIDFKIQTPLKLCPQNGGIEVNEFMQTNIPSIYAAGDCCEAKWNLSKHWFQMKLWTQARQMGAYAAKSIVGHANNENVVQDFCFEIFTHSTKLFGYKVILLGLFNGQKLNNNYEILLRVTKNKEYIKLILQNHKLQGAILIGDTDLEEMCENLIINQLDLEPFGDDILNPNIDIEDYFD